jgi:hypothetical protein
VFEEERLCDDRSRTTAADEFGDRDAEVEKENGQMPHPIIVTAGAGLARLGNPQKLCNRFIVRQGQPSVQTNGVSVGGPSRSSSRD